MRVVPEVGIDRASKVEQELCEAYWRLGQAFAAEHDHPDQDHQEAAKVCSATNLLLCLAARHQPSILHNSNELCNLSL